MISSSRANISAAYSSRVLEGGNGECITSDMGMDALKRSTANDKQPAKGKKPRKAAAGQKEMLLPIAGKRTAKLARQLMIQ
jgi:DNA end-binding protein Ku